MLHRGFRTLHGGFRSVHRGFRVLHGGFRALHGGFRMLHGDFRSLQHGIRAWRGRFAAKPASPGVLPRWAGASPASAPPPGLTPLVWMAGALTSA